MLLAIDTATHYSSLALHDEHRLIAEESWLTPSPNHAVELAPALQRLMRRSAVQMSQLTALAVCVGPGSYTGLRVGVALAKGIAAAASLPLIGVSALDILAAGYPQTAGALVAVVAAGRGRIVAAAYQWRKGRWKARNEPVLLTWETLIDTIDGPASLTGEIEESGFTALTDAQTRGVPITIGLPAHRLRRAGFLAEEAWARLRQQPENHHPAHVVPVYVKTKDTP